MALAPRNGIYIGKFGQPNQVGNAEYGFSIYYNGFCFEFEDYANSLEELDENSKVVLINADSKTVVITSKCK